MEQPQRRITYKRVKNLGNYESETLEVSTTIADDADIEVAIVLLREKVLTHLGLMETEENVEDLLEDKVF